MDSKHRRTLEAIFTEPTRTNIAWRDVESLLKALDARLMQGAGSRVQVKLNGVRATFHRPHPGKEAVRPVVRSVRSFLERAGVKP